MPSRKTRKTKKTCFYCNGLVTDYCENDHFPLPASVGGEATVPCCVSCHDMKDRYNLDEWPDEWVQKIIDDFPKLSRETRLFLAKSLRVLAVAGKQFGSTPS